VKRAIVLGPDALRQFRKLRAKDRSRLHDAMLATLGEDDATIEARNRFRLRRPSEFADFELQVILIGRKKGTHLIIGGKRFTL
jgi:hypothetical protein